MIPISFFVNKKAQAGDHSTILLPFFIGHSFIKSRLLKEKKITLNNFQARNLFKCNNKGTAKIVYIVPKLTIKKPLTSIELFLTRAFITNYSKVLIKNFGNAF